MDSKLTLKLDQEVIEKPKRYPLERKLSLLKLIKNYLASITGEKTEVIEISPFVKRRSSGTRLPTDYDYKQNYYDQLSQKHS